MEKTINLDQWYEATTDQRFEWLMNNVRLDQTSQFMLDWSLAFIDAGAYIPTDVLLRAYHTRLASFLYQ